MPSEEEKKIHKLEERIVQLEQALQEKKAANTMQSSQPQMPPVSPPHTAIPNKPSQTSPFQTVSPPYVPPTASQQPTIPNRSPQTSSFQTVPPPYVPPVSPQYTAIPNRSPQQSMPQQPAQAMDMEQKFGRMVMGILASVFVFAAILIGYAFLPGWMQAVGLYIIGIAVSAIGLYGIAKKTYRYFFLSVAGCGAGILYLSIFLSYWYFSVIGKWAMYGMLLLWAVLVLWISRKGVPLFRLIGQCGIFLSLLFAFRDMNLLQTSLIFLFFVFVSALYQFADRRIGIAPNLSTLLCNAFALPVLTLLLNLTIRRERDTGAIWLFALVSFALLFFTLAQLLWYRFRMREAEQSGIGFFFVQLYVLFLVWIQGKTLFFFWENGQNLIAAAAVLGSFLLYDREQEQSVLRNLIACFAGCIAFLLLLSVPAAMAIPGWLVLTAVLIAVAMVRKHAAFGYLGYILFLLGISMMLSKVEFLDDIILQYGAWVVIDVFVTLYFRYCKPHRGMEIVSACVTGLLMLDGLFLLIMVSIANAIKHLADAFFSLFDISHGVDAILWETILLVCFVVVVFALNVSYLMQHYRNRNGVGVYLGIRTTLLGIVVTGIFCSAALSSALMTLISFATLLAGFFFRQKGLRIYSLVLMLVFLCKLLLLDLSYDTPLLWAGAFLLCGLLCFGISFAYNRIGQTYGKETPPMSPEQPAFPPPIDSNHT